MVHGGTCFARDDAPLEWVSSAALFLASSAFSTHTASASSFTCNGT